MNFDQYVDGLRQERPAVAGGGAGGLAGPENVVVLASTASTNDVARGIANDLDSEGLNVEPTLILAFEQTGGRGRQGRSWASPRGRGVYATLAQPFADAALLQTLPLLVGVGLCRALGPHLAHGCRLKWPNDLLVPEGAGAGGGRTGRTALKIGGVLIEARVQPEDGGVAFIGFGVNHGHQADELPPGATSLAIEGGADAVSLAQLTWQLVAGVEAELAHAGDAGYAVRAYQELSIHRLGDPLAWRAGDREVRGTFAGFDELGRLLLRPDEGGGDPSGHPAGESIGHPAESIALSAGEVIEW